MAAASSDERPPSGCAAPRSAAEAFFDSPSAYLRYDFQIRIRALIAREWLGAAAGKSMVDVGCGNGGVSLQFLPDLDCLVLVDTSQSMLDAARSGIGPGMSAKVSLVRADFRQWTPGTAFDVVICMGVLAYVADHEAALARVASLLKPGGLCCLQLTDASRPLGWVHYRLGMLRHSLARRANLLSRCSSASLLETCKRLGLINQGLRRHSLLLPGMGLLPNSCLFRWERFVLENSLLSRAGSECVLFLQKEEL